MFEITPSPPPPTSLICIICAKITVSYLNVSVVGVVGLFFFQLRMELLVTDSSSVNHVINGRRQSQPTGQRLRAAVTCLNYGKDGERRGNAVYRLISRCIHVHTIE